MELILIRHADAEPADGYAQDDLRPLTAKGHKVHRKVAEGLKRMEVRPDRILCSPRLRAVETAEITAAAVGRGEVEEHSVLDGGYRVTDLIDALAAYRADETIVCVGHEPDLSTWAGELLGGGPVRVHFPKSAVLGLHFEGIPTVGAAVLEWFYRAQDLQALLE